MGRRRRGGTLEARWDGGGAAGHRGNVLIGPPVPRHAFQPAFTDRFIFKYGEIDAVAADAYFERACDAFSRSSEARQVIERHGDLRWFRTLLDFGLNYLGKIVDEMTLESVQEFVFDYVPRKVSTEADAAAEILDELAMFWRYLDRVYKLPAAKTVVEWLETDGLVASLTADLSNPSNFGMAKSLVMVGKNAGYDMTSEAGIAQFMAAYNRSLVSADAPAAPPPIPRNQRIGRNDPCPCGSGKKFKKRCGHRAQHGPN